MAIQIQTATSQHLPAIKKLWRVNSSTLGFFPDGAFETHLKNGWIIAAVENGSVLGYSIYRLSKGRAAIAHLCVDDKARGQGIARKLVDEVKRVTRKCAGIIVSCRRDFAVNKLWPHFEFEWLRDRPGRSNDALPLSLWWHDNGGGNLFSPRNHEDWGEDEWAVLDANTVFSWKDGHEETEGLAQGWVESEVRFCVTSEVFNEISRQDDPLIRESSHKFATTFTTIDATPAKILEAKNALKSILPSTGSAADISDFRQLSNAIAGEANFFITRDGRLLNKASEIKTATGISVVRPSELITHLDSLLREDSYQPSRLAGSGLSITQVKGSDESRLWDAFGATGSAETKGGFSSIIRTACSHPREHELLLVENKSGEPLAIVCISKHQGMVLDVPLLRVRRGPLGPTLSHHLINEIVDRAGKGERPVVAVTDRFLSSQVLTALNHLSFEPMGHYWGKVGIGHLGSVDSFKDKLNGLSNVPQPFQPIVTQARQRLSKVSWTSSESRELEQQLWPACFSESQLPVYIVPILPHWAIHLFDSGLANEQLLPVVDRIALNRENVYYSRTRMAMKYPARILWYVSAGRLYANSMQIRACSTLNQVTTGTPKAMFKQFEKLGIFSWPNIMAMTNNDLDKTITAMRFSGTLRFPNPMKFHDVQDILKRTRGKGNNFQGPVEISQDCFETIFNACMKFQEQHANV